jgi:hypothetical protein
MLPASSPANQDLFAPTIMINAPDVYLNSPTQIQCINRPLTRINNPTS